MAKINVIHDNVGKTLTIHFSDPTAEYSSELSEEGIIIMKDKDGKLIGLEILQFENMPDEGISLKILPENF